MKYLSLILILLMVAGVAVAQDQAPQKKVEKAFISIEGMD